LYSTSVIVHYKTFGAVKITGAKNVVSFDIQLDINKIQKFQVITTIFYSAKLSPKAITWKEKSNISSIQLSIIEFANLVVEESN